MLPRCLKAGAFLNVLIIEDNAMIAMLYEELLIQNGHHVCGTARTENEAVAMAEGLQPI